MIYPNIDHDRPIARPGIGLFRWQEDAKQLADINQYLGMLQLLYDTTFLNPHNSEFQVGSWRCYFKVFSIYICEFTNNSSGFKRVTCFGRQMQTRFDLEVR